MSDPEQPAEAVHVETRYYPALPIGFGDRVCPEGWVWTLTQGGRVLLSGKSEYDPGQILSVVAAALAAEPSPLEPWVKPAAEDKDER